MYAVFWFDGSMHHEPVVDIDRALDLANVNDNDAERVRTLFRYTKPGNYIVINDCVILYRREVQATFVTHGDGGMFAW